MDEDSLSPVPTQPPAKDKVRPSAVIEPLTRSGCKRQPMALKHIESAIALNPAALIERARQRDEDAAGYMSAEALVYFIRRADRNGDRQTRDALIRELLQERCTPFFRGQFRGFDQHTREDLQGDVLCKVVEDLLAKDDSSDFMQDRFWLYLKRRAIDACRKMLRQSEDTESLDAGYAADDKPETPSKLERIADEQLTPEELAVLSQALHTLPPRLRHVYLLRHYVGMQIGSDNPANEDGGEVTLARHLNCTGRTIRNWLREADGLLVGFREREDDDA